MAKKSKKEVELEAEEPSEEQEVAIFSEEDLENSGLRELVDKGKEQGFLTYEEINAMYQKTSLTLIRLKKPYRC